MLVTFDLEGTLIDGELFPELSRRLGYGQMLETLTRETMRGDLPFEEALELRASMIRGESIQRIREVADSLPLVPGATETLQTLKRMSLTPIILTGGFDLLALRVAAQLGIDHVRCNRFQEKDGRVIGVGRPIVTPQAKADHLKELAEILGTFPSHCVAVGDGANDIPMFQAAGMSIAFNASPKVKEAARVSVEGLDLTAILPYITRYFN